MRRSKTGRSPGFPPGLRNENSLILSRIYQTEFKVSLFLAGPTGLGAFSFLNVVSKSVWVQTLEDSNWRRSHSKDWAMNPRFTSMKHGFAERK